MTRTSTSVRSAAGAGAQANKGVPALPAKDTQQESQKQKKAFEPINSIASELPPPLSAKEQRKLKKAAKKEGSPTQEEPTEKPAPKAQKASAPAT
ncbi:hypothetical protein HK104_000388, partial [Borealophlyctis nickersoniae]